MISLKQHKNNVFTLNLIFFMCLAPKSHVSGRMLQLSSEVYSFFQSHRNLHFSNIYSNSFLKLLKQLGNFYCKYFFHNNKMVVIIKRKIIKTHVTWLILQLKTRHMHKRSFFCHIRNSFKMQNIPFFLSLSINKKCDT